MRGFRFELARLTALYLVFWPLERLVSQASRLPSHTYEQPVIVATALRQLVVGGPEGNLVLVNIVASAGGLALCIVGRRTLFRSWTDLDALRPLRPAALTMVGLVAWAFSTYDYNLYFDRSHLVDRALLVLVGGLAIWRPIFMLPVVVVGLVIMGQLQYPLGRFSPTHYQLAFHGLLVCVAALAVQSMRVRLRTWHIMAVMLSLVASGYLKSGIDKIALGWPFDEQTHHLLFATYANGWLGFLSPTDVATMGRTLAYLDPLVAWGTLGLELGVLAFFWGRRSATVLLLGCAVFHLAILAVSGIFFWMWVAIEVVLVVVLYRLSSDDRSSLFSHRMIATSVVLVPLAIVWFQPTSLSWLDVPLSYTYRFQGIGESGQRYALPPSVFAPYRYVFTVWGLDEVAPDPLLDITWGAAGPAVARALRTVDTPEDVLRIERELGRRRLDPDRARVADAFLQRWLTNQYRRRRGVGWTNPLQAPPQLLTFSPPDTYPGSEPIREVEVRLVRSFFDGIRYLEFTNEVIHRIVIPPPTR